MPLTSLDEVLRYADAALQAVEDFDGTDAHYGLIRRSRIAKLPTEEHATWPLHAAGVQTLNLDAIKLRLNGRSLQRIGDLFGLCNTSALTAQDPHLKVPDERVSILLQAGVCERYKGPLKGASEMLYFEVVEENKRRLRPIMWPRSLMRVRPYEANFTTPAVEQQRLIALANFGVTYDLTASYRQVRLPDSVKLLLRAEDGTWLRMTRMPYGLHMASEAMAIIVEALAGDALRCSPAHTLKGTSITHIDNVAPHDRAPAIRRC